MSNQLTIFFHSGNNKDAKRILEDLGQYNIELNPLTEKDFKYNFLSIVESIDTPILLLLSQNWLESDACLYNALPVLEKIQKDKKLFVVLIEGVVSEYGIDKRIPTKIDTVANAMAYMKYWQETYLNARSLRRKSDTADMQLQETAAKSISIEIGKIINFFRELNPTNIESLTGSNYQPFFDHFGFSSKLVEKKVVTPILENEEIRNDKVTVSESFENLEKEHEVNEFVQEEDLTTQIYDVPVSKEEILVEDEEMEASFYDKFKEDVSVEEDTIMDEFELSNIKNKLIEGSAVTQLYDGVNETQEPLKSADLEWFENELNPSISVDKEELFSMSVDNLLEKAATYFEDGEDELGFGLFENAIESTHSNNTTLRYYYAYYLAQKKANFEEAINQLDTILLFDSKNDNAYFLLAELAEIKGNFALAKNYYLETLRINPNYPQINYRVGVILKEHFKGADKESAEYFLKEIKKDDNNVDALYRLGIYNNEILEDTDQAESFFTQVLAKDPEHGFVNYDLALIYHKKGDPLKAAFFYQEGCKNNPELKTEQNDRAFLEHEEEDIKPKIVFNTPQDEAAKTILITGATSGIGLATAEQFAKAGNCKLILAGRRKKRLIQISEAIKDNYGVPTTYLVFDIREVKAVADAIASLEAPFLDIDVLINNAGLALGFSDIVNGDLADWETMIDTNVKGLLYATKEVAPKMIAQNSGHIINIGSIAGKEAYPNGNVYNATKAAVDMLTKAMRLDLHKYNIRVGQVAPGHVETEFAINRFHGDEKKANIYKDFTPLSPIDIANIIFFMVAQPAHVNIQDVLVFPTQQASATIVNRSGKL